MPRFNLKSLFLALFLAGCGGGMEGGLVNLTPVNDGGPPKVMDAGTGMTLLCGPQELCERSINECKATLTQVQCEGWYAKTTNCRDMQAYTACNCDCVTEATCSDYFACGNICFNDHCK